MKTKTIDDIIEIITLVRKSDISGINSELLIKCNKMLLEEKQRKEQKKVKQSAKERLAYANGIALGIATNYTLNEKKNIMDNARSKAAIYFSTKPMEFVPLTDKTISVQETDKGTYIVTVKFNQPEAAK